MQRGLAVAEVFAHFCQATGIEDGDIAAVATSAIRDAANRDAFVSRAPLPVRVLSVDEEARYGYLAAVNSTTLTDGAVLDLGGGSLQLVRGGGGHEGGMGSWGGRAGGVDRGLLGGGGAGGREGGGQPRPPRGGQPPPARGGGA